MSYPLFNRENPGVYPIKQVGGGRLLLHCAEHQQAHPVEGEEDTEAMTQSTTVNLLKNVGINITKLKMDKEQILKKVIEKAVKGGWKLGSHYLELTKQDPSPESVSELQDAIIPDLKDTYYAIIFDHSFCKAFFGDGEKLQEKDYKGWFRYPNEPGYDGHVRSPMPAWQYYLQQLALSEDRLKYLSQFLND